MRSRDYFYIFWSFLLLFGIAACDRNTPGQPTANVATPRPALSTPSFTAAEAPLHGGLVEIPEVWIAASRQSKAALVTYLYRPQSAEALSTLIDLLDCVNPDLPDPVLPGTLVVIPPVYRVSQSEPLSAIAATVGVPEDLMRAANPALPGQKPLAAGTAVVLPRLYVVTHDTLLSAAADMLQTDDQDLIRANPSLADQPEVRSGTVLVVPLPKEAAP